MSGRSYNSFKNFIWILRGRKPRLSRESVVNLDERIVHLHSRRGKVLSKRDELVESKHIDIESDKTRSDGRSLRNFRAPRPGRSATGPIEVLEAYGALYTPVPSARKVA